MLKGRLGLETARIPHADRHGLLWLSRGELCVVDGCQYQGRAVCAQPFCAQMNYLWSVARAQSRA